MESASRVRASWWPCRRPYHAPARRAGRVVELRACRQRPGKGDPGRRRRQRAAPAHPRSRSRRIRVRRASSWPRWQRRDAADSRPAGRGTERVGETGSTNRGRQRHQPLVVGPADGRNGEGEPPPLVDVATRWSFASPDATGSGIPPARRERGVQPRGQADAPGHAHAVRPIFSRPPASPSTRRRRRGRTPAGHAEAVAVVPWSDHLAKAGVSTKPTPAIMRRPRCPGCRPARAAGRA